MHHYRERFIQGECSHYRLKEVSFLFFTLKSLKLFLLFPSLLLLFQSHPISQIYPFMTLFRNYFSLLELKFEGLPLQCYLKMQVFRIQILGYQLKLKIGQGCNLGFVFKKPLRSQLQFLRITHRQLYAILMICKLNLIEINKGSLISCHSHHLLLIHLLIFY